MTRSILLTAAALLLFVSHAVSQRDFSSVEFKTVHVAGNIHMLDSGIAGNIGLLVGDDGILMIDDQFAPLAGKIRAATAKISDGKLKFLVNTHWHGDHTGGNGIFGKETTIMAHTNVRKRLSAEQSGAALPVVTFGDSVSLHMNGEDVEIVHFPKGHTDGDSILFFKQSNVVHMGDHFFAGRFPYIDLGSGGNVQGYMDNVKKVIDRSPSGVKIIPGHGPLSTLDDLKEFHVMMVKTTAAVRGHMKDGKSLEEIQKAGLASEWKDWGGGFINQDRWIEIVYNSYS